MKCLTTKGLYMRVFCISGYVNYVTLTDLVESTNYKCLEMSLLVYLRLTKTK